MITLADVAAARERLAAVVRPTPVRETDSISQACGRTVLLKPENTQRTGSYKVRWVFSGFSSTVRSHAWLMESVWRTGVGRTTAATRSRAAARSARVITVPAR